jgi:hypothetical protein
MIASRPFRKRRGTESGSESMDPAMRWLSAFIVALAILILLDTVVIRLIDLVRDWRRKR